jgi:membrane associated rhomboid family serine protease
MLKMIMCPFIKPISFTTISCLAMLAGFALQLAVDHLKIPGMFLEINSNGFITRTFGKNPTKIHDDYAYYELVTALFLSVDFMHITTNLISQLIFGSFIENLVGTLQMALIFFTSGAWANLFSSAVSHKDLSIGSSGAIFGELGAMVGYIVVNWKKLDESIRCRLMFYVALILFFNFLVFDPNAQTGGAGIDILGHIGGLISGVFLGMGLLPKEANSSWALYENKVKIVGWALFVLSTIGVIAVFFTVPW